MQRSCITASRICRTCTTSAIATARLFYQLHKVTGEPDYLEWTEKLARGVIRAGVPERLTPGYWNVACQCCGAAAEVDFFLSLWLATGKSTYRDFARRVADQLISRESNLDGKGYRWYQAWTRVKPWKSTRKPATRSAPPALGRHSYTRTWQSQIDIARFCFPTIHFREPNTHSGSAIPR
jgi:hypothetical protein